MSQPKRARPPRLPSAWVIFKRSLADYRTHWKGYLKIMAIVAIPVNLVSLFNLGTADSAAQSYMSFATIVMNVALVWALSYTQENGHTPKLHEAYYKSSEALVRFLLVSMALVVFLIPLAFGLSLWLVALQASDYYGRFGPEQYMLGALAGLLAVPSLYLLGRYLFGPIAIVREGLRPIVGLRRSRSLTTGRFWQIWGRIVLMTLFLGLVLIPSFAVMFGLNALGLPAPAFIAFQILSTLTVLPLLSIYLFQLYLALDEATSPI